MLEAALAFEARLVVMAYDLVLVMFAPSPIFDDGLGHIDDGWVEFAQVHDIAEATGDACL